MKWLRRRIRRDESGTSLLLAIGFMVLAGAITTALVTSIGSTSLSRVNLDIARNREYAADGGIEYAITQVRQLTPSPGVGFSNCEPAQGYTLTLNNVGVRVDCQNAPTLTQGGFLQRNVVFSACAGTSPCTAANTIIRAEVNFEAITQPNGSLLVTNTTVQSWSVNE